LLRRRQGKGEESMIEDIVAMILYEAHQRPGANKADVIYQVLHELVDAVDRVIDKARFVGRWKKEDENKG